MSDATDGWLILTRNRRTDGAQMGLSRADMELTQPGEVHNATQIDAPMTAAEREAPLAGSPFLDTEARLAEYCAAAAEDPSNSMSA